EAGKSAAKRPAWDSPAFAEWVEDVFDGLGIEQATLVGISQGAWTALKFAVVMPERVARLVLMTPGGIVPDRASFLPRAIGLMLLGKPGVKRLVRALFADQPVPESVIDSVVQTMRQFKPRIGKLPIFSDAELRRLTMPVLLLGGTKDVLRDMRSIEARLRKCVPDLSVITIPGAGHALINTSAAILEFLLHASSRVALHHNAGIPPLPVYNGRLMDASVRNNRCF
ncbi:MAG: alpha/beta hydrolase, partial [Chloroflexota bacterium]